MWLLPPPDSPRDVPYDELDTHERGRADSYRCPTTARCTPRRMWDCAGSWPDTPVSNRASSTSRRAAQGQRRTARPAAVLGVPGGAPQFSLSHSHGLAIVVVAEARVGADVQRLPSAETVEVCLRRCTRPSGRSSGNCPNTSGPWPSA
ncbi:hypothetical protein ACFQ51_21880 [Streptomyces kaempferi]